MKYKLDIQEDAPLGPIFAVQLSLTDVIPNYNYSVPAEHWEAFEEFGLAELMEGIFEFPENKIDEIDDFLLNLGYEKEDI